MNTDQIKELREEVRRGHVDAMIALADEPYYTDHPHRDELLNLANTAGFFDDPACALVAGANFLLLMEDTEGKLPRTRA